MNAHHEGTPMTDDTIRILSLMQPYAWMVVHGGKNIENRRWNTSYRGPFLIHASAGMTARYYEEAMVFARQAMGETYAPWPTLQPEKLQFGGIIGRARITAVMPPMAKWIGARYPASVDSRWHMTEQFGFCLADIEPVPFTLWRGGLGLRKLPMKTAEELLPGTEAWRDDMRARPMEKVL